MDEPNDVIEFLAAIAERSVEMSEQEATEAYTKLLEFEESASFLLRAIAMGKELLQTRVVVGQVMRITRRDDDQKEETTMSDDKRSSEDSLEVIFERIERMKSTDRRQAFFAALGEMPVNSLRRQQLLQTGRAIFATGPYEAGEFAVLHPESVLASRPLSAEAQARQDAHQVALLALQDAERRHADASRALAAAKAAPARYTQYGEPAFNKQELAEQERLRQQLDEASQALDAAREREHRSRPWLHFVGSRNVTYELLARRSWAGVA